MCTERPRIRRYFLTVGLRHAAWQAHAQSHVDASALFNLLTRVRTIDCLWTVICVANNPTRGRLEKQSGCCFGFAVSVVTSIVTGQPRSGFKLGDHRSWCPICGKPFRCSDAHAVHGFILGS